MDPHALVTGQVALTLASGRKQVDALFFQYEGVELAITPASNAPQLWQVTHVATGLKIPNVGGETPESCKTAFLFTAPKLTSTSGKPLMEILSSAEADPQTFIANARLRLAVQN